MASTSKQEAIKNLNDWSPGLGDVFATLPEWVYEYKSAVAVTGLVVLTLIWFAPPLIKLLFNRDGEHGSKSWKLRKLRIFHSSVEPIIKRRLAKDISEEDFEIYAGEANDWADECAEWIEENLGMDAKKRFFDRTGMQSTRVKGTINETHSAIVLNLTRYQGNLLQLIESDEWKDS